VWGQGAVRVCAQIWEGGIISGTPDEEWSVSVYYLLRATKM